MRWPVVDSLEHFPVDHPMRGTIAGIFERMCHALERVQDAERGIWHQVLNMAGREGNYPETSGSCMFVYALAMGVRAGVHLKGICHGAGLGGTPYRDGTYEYYINEAIVEDVLMGTAPFLLASTEIEKLLS
jgi:unsaturated rhamnogalacturonyl hydrolase